MNRSTPYKLIHCSSDEQVHSHQLIHCSLDEQVSLSPFTSIAGLKFKKECTPGFPLPVSVFPVGQAHPQHSWSPVLASSLQKTEPLAIPDTVESRETQPTYRVYTALASVESTQL